LFLLGIVTKAAKSAVVNINKGKAKCKRLQRMSSCSFSPNNDDADGSSGATYYASDGSVEL